MPVQFIARCKYCFSACASSLQGAKHLGAGGSGAFVFLALALLLGAPATAQETVYIGGRASGPAVEVDLSVLQRGGIPVRRTRPGPPDILPLDPANAPPARATSTAPLAMPQPLTPAALPARAPAAAAAAAPALPDPASPKAVSPGLTPAAPPPAQTPRAALTPAARPNPILPAGKAAAQSPAPAPAPLPIPQFTAALPAGSSAAPPPVSAAARAALLFAPGAVELSPEAMAQLDALAASLSPNERVQIKAHASGGQDDALVRRIALKRALAARSHLLAGGMDSTRIDVRALGPAADGGSDDRLDLIVVAQ